MSRRMYIFLFLVVFPSSGMEPLVVQASDDVSSLVEVPLKDFLRRLKGVHKRLVAEEPDKVADFLKDLVEVLYESRFEEERTVKLHQALTFYQSQLSKFKFCDLLGVYTYLGNLIESTPDCFDVITGFYASLKKIGISIAPSTRSVVIPGPIEVGSTSKQSTTHECSEEIVSSGSLLISKGQIVSPRFNRERFSQSLNRQAEQTPSSHKKGFTDTDIKNIIGRQVDKPHSRVALHRSQSFAIPPQDCLSESKPPSLGSSQWGTKKRSSSFVQTPGKRTFKKGSNLVAGIQNAVRRGDVAVLQESVATLRDKKMIDVYLAEGKTLLHWSIEKDNIALAILLLQYGANGEVRDSSDRTPLMVAIEAKKEAFYTLFLEKAIDVSQCDGMKRTALHYAVYYGLLEVVEKLLVKDPTLVNKQDSYGYTPVMVAIIYDNPEPVLLLLINGADMVTYKDDNGNIALHHAAASKTCLTRTIGAQVRYSSVEELNAKNKEGFTPSMSAVLKKNWDAVEWFIEQGTDVSCDRNELNQEGNTLLMVATILDCREFCQKLLGLGVQLSCRNAEGNTALHLAAQCGNAFLCKLFLAHDSKCGINVRNNRNNTPLMCATQAGQNHLVVLLLKNGADAQCLGDDGKSAHQIATELGSASLFDLSKYVCAHCKSQHSLTEEHFLCDVRHGKLVNVAVHIESNLLRVGARDKEGRSALVLAAGNGQLDVVTLLLKNGADKNALSEALTAAQKGKHTAVVTYLKEM